MKAAGHAYALVVAFEDRYHALDCAANPIVVADELLPRHGAATAECCARETGDERRLAEELHRRRLEHATRRLDDSHRVFRRHELHAASLYVALGAAEAGENQRLLAGDEMRAVRLDRDVRREAATPQRRRDVLGIGGGLKEVTA